MFYFRLNKVKIFNNREDGGLFGKDEAEVELWSILATDNTPLPNMNEFLATNNSVERRELAKALVKDYIDLKQVTSLDKVKDDQPLRFGSTGYVIYQSETIPTDFNWNLIAIEIDEAQRDDGKLLQNVLDSPNFDDFTNDLEEVTIGVANPTFAAAKTVGKFVANAITSKWQNNDDDLIGNLLTSMNRQEHYQDGKREERNVNDLTNNMRVNFSLFTTTS